MSNQTLKQQIQDFSDHWPLHKTPESMVNLAVCKNYGLCVDANDQVYYSDLSGLALNWILLDFKASAISVSYDGSTVWLMHKKSVHRLKNHSEKSLFDFNNFIISSFLFFINLKRFFRSYFKRNRRNFIQRFGFCR